MSFLRSGLSYLAGCLREVMCPLPEPPPRKTAGKKILFIEDRIPVDSGGAGYPRSNSILFTLSELGYELTLYPLLFPFEAAHENVPSVVPDGCEIVSGCGRRKLLPFLRARLSYYDIIIVSRPHNLKFFNKTVRQLKSFPGKIKVVYDAEALFARREIGRLELSGSGRSQAFKDRMIDAELREAGRADLVLAVSEKEKEVFLSRSAKSAAVVGFSLDTTPSRTPFEERRDLLFVGNLDDDLSPNTDSVIWFTKEILPLIRLKEPGIRLHVVGSCRAGKLKGLAAGHTIFHGRVEELAPFFESARLFIAPTRYVAGLPHKVFLSAANGVPVVATDVLVRGTGWLPGREILDAPLDDPGGFADRCLELYRNPELWHTIRDNAMERIERDCSADLFRKSLGNALNALE
jgi:glycosyltransferase involved in cell wall biosynthesis